MKHSSVLAGRKILRVNRPAIRIALILFLSLAAIVTRAADTPKAISLAGQWYFKLDPADALREDAWFDRVLPHRISLPGALQTQGYRDDISVETQWTANVNDRS